MVELRLGVIWGSRPSSDHLCIEVNEDVTCKEFLKRLAEDCEWRKDGAWHLVERWNGCERRLNDGERLAEAVREWGWEGGRVYLKRERDTSVRSVKGGRRRRRRRRRKMDYLSGAMTSKKLSHLRRDLKLLSVSVASQASTLWLQRLTQQCPLAGDHAISPLEPFRERLLELRKTNLQLSTDISELNISSGLLTGELQALKAEESELGECVRRVEEDVERMRRERERESRSKMADLQAEIIRLKRELETRNRLNAAQSTKLKSQKAILEERRKENLARAKWEGEGGY